MFCNCLMERCNNNRFLHNLVIDDEATFCLNGKMYASKGEPPSFNYDVHCSRQKVSAVWAGICGNGTLVGLYFFQNNVNGRNYLEMLENFVFPVLVRNFNIQNGNDGLRNLWWMQNGAPAHRTRNVKKDWLRCLVNKLSVLALILNGQLVLLTSPRVISFFGDI